MPQLRDLWMVDADGHPVVSGTVFPMPRSICPTVTISVSIAIGAMARTSAKCWMPASPHTKFFVISRRREVNGRFAGITIVSIAPEYFFNFYSQVAGARNSLAGAH